MKTPFPGMDPYLEHPSDWQGVHNEIMAAMHLDLAPRLRPRYRVRIEQRTYLTELEGALFVGRPDVAVVEDPRGHRASRSAPTKDSRMVAVEVPVPDRINESYLEVRRVGTEEVVTVIELLSPTNKRPGEGRRVYEEKRLRILGTRTSLVEVDLVRSGEPMTWFGATDPSDYRILISRGHERPRAHLLPFGVRDPIPRFPLPLGRGEREPEVDLGAILHDLYERASYDLGTDYTKEPVPPLSRSDRAWTHQLLARAGLR